MLSDHIKTNTVAHSHKRRTDSHSDWHANESKTALPQTDLIIQAMSETTDSEDSLAREVYQLYLDRAATGDTSRPDDENFQKLENFGQCITHQKLDGHWSDDRCKTCPSCRERKRYNHGIFCDMDPGEKTAPISLHLARVKAEQMSTSIWKHFEHLKAIIERYETVIHKRWAKKSGIKRKQALQTAWASISDRSPPPMPEMHRPDVFFLRNLCKGEAGCRCGTPQKGKRHLFLWPRLNLEDLAKLEPLLLLLNARGRNSPPTFAFADLQPVYFGLRCGHLSHPPYLDMYNMLFTGQEGPELYGKIVSWKEDPGAYRRLHLGRDTSPGEGLWVLEIQERLYSFLVNICQVILYDQPIHDRDRHRLLDQPLAPEPPLPTANGQDKDNGTSLMMTRYESAYHVPAKLDNRRLQNLVESKMAEAEDTLWALREDPSFMAATLAEVYTSLAQSTFLTLATGVTP